MIQALQRWLSSFSSIAKRLEEENRNQLSLQNKLAELEAKLNSFAAAAAQNITSLHGQYHATAQRLESGTEAQQQFLRKTVGETQTAISNLCQLIASDTHQLVTETVSSSAEVRSHVSTELSNHFARFEPAILQSLSQLHDQVLSLAQSIADLSSRQGSTANEVNAILNTVLPIQHSVQELEARILNFDPALQRANIEALIAHTQGIAASLSNMDAELSARHGAIANEINATLNAVLPMQRSSQSVEQRILDFDPSQQKSSLNGLIAYTQGLTTTLSTMEAAISARQGKIANEVNATLNAVLPLQNRTATLEAKVATLDETLAAERALDQTHSMLLARSMMEFAKQQASSATSKKLSVAGPLAFPSLSDQMAAFKAAAPNNFEAWHKAYLAGIEEGQRTPEGNLSHEGHIGAGYFRMFVNVHARGRILDVGCGPLPLPAYLADCPVERLAGIDPQPPDQPHPFPFARTFAETIPWPNASFETVVVGTSLDHVYLLDKALSEIKRVLVPNGRLLLWTAMMEHTPPYNPYSPKFQPPDQYHLFHPGRNWFYDQLDKDYRMIERLRTVASAELLAWQRNN